MFLFQCQNLKIVPADQLLKWRFDTWVTIMATLSSLGLLTSICLTFFLACKLCTQVLEASQTTSFLLLFAIMFAYICFIPYGMYILGLSSVHIISMLHTLYNARLRIARNFLETKENIKILTHPFYHVNLDRFSWEWSKKKFFFFWKKIQNGRFSKMAIFQNRQFSKFFRENFTDSSLG